MRHTGRLVVNPRRVVHETIDGETILIHLETGAYYSLEGSGAEIWNLLVAGWTEDELCDEVARRYPGDGDAPAGPAPQAVPDVAFATPALKKYTDMEYFLLLDPIHEVEEAGWPHERPAEPVAADSADVAQGRAGS